MASPVELEYTPGQWGPSSSRGRMRAIAEDPRFTLRMLRRNQGVRRRRGVVSISWFCSSVTEEG